MCGKVVYCALAINIYAEAIFEEALENAEESILVNGHRINNLRYTDDTILLTSNFNFLQNLIQRMDIISNY